MQTSPKGAFTRSGFTLIELLVVIAIIAILASILFPVFGRARENARRSACMSNMKQIGLGILQYVQDYDERYPNCGAAGSAVNTGLNPWPNVVRPYIKSNPLFYCPSNMPNPMSNTPQADRVSTNYLANGNSGSGVNGFKYARPMDQIAQDGTFYMSRSIAEAVEPSRTFLLVEYVAPSGGTYTRQNVASTSTTNGQLNLMNHLGTSNYLFADGHAKALKPLATISGGANMWSLDPANTAADSTLQAALGAMQSAMQ